MKRAHLLITALAICLCSFATTYYCSPDGTGDGTAITSPGNFDAVWSVFKGGDTLYCLSGVYYRDNRITIGSSKQGTADRRTVIAAAPGHKPVFDFYQEPYGERGFVVSTGVTYIHMRGLTLRYSGKNALLNQGSYCLFENLDVYGNGDTGVQMKTGGNNVILNCDSHDNFDYQTTSGTQVNYGGNADGFADKQFSGAPNRYIGCRAWNNSDDGWDFFQRVTTGGPNVLENCICYRSGPAEYNMTGNPRILTDAASWFNSFPKQVTDRYGNTITASIEHYPNIGNGNGFKIGGNSTANDVKLVNCLAVGCAYRGFDQNNNVGAMTIYNCTAYDNNPNYGFPGTGNSSLDIKNSISLKSRQSDNFNIPSLTSDHNSWNTSGVKCDATDFASLDTAAYMLAPRNDDFSLPTTPLLRLLETSDMIDAGVNVGLPYSGAAPDLGCYEFGDALNYPGQLNIMSGSREQSIIEGQSITSVTLQWAGGATGVEYTSLPEGISVSINEGQKTVTISGTPTGSGAFSITLTTTVDGDVETASVTLTFYVKPANAKRIAFLTIPNAASDKPMLDALNGELGFLVTILDATQSTLNTSGYDMLFISSAPASTSAGMMAAKGAGLPTLLLKPFQLKATAWNWGNAVNTADMAVNVLQPEHPIFKNINVTDGYATLFNAVERNAVTAIDNWFHSTPRQVLATAQSNSGYEAVVEINAGTEIDGITLTDRLLMIGVSEYSTANLSADGVTLITNACHYLLGSEPYSTALNATESDLSIRRTPTSITARAQHEIVRMKLISPSGMVAAQTAGNTINTSTLPKGVYILSVRTINGIKTLKIVL